MSKKNKSWRHHILDFKIFNNVTVVNNTIHFKFTNRENLKNLLNEEQEEGGEGENGNYMKSWIYSFA